MIYIGQTSSVFDFITYVLMFFIICPAVLGGDYGAVGVSSATFMALFNAGWFVESLWSQTLVIHALKTPKLPFIESRASLKEILVTSLGIAKGTILPYTGVGAVLGMIPLPWFYSPLVNSYDGWIYGFSYCNEKSIY